ncbi:hypothetical protein ANN_26579 [Periplaneta americana]|uniref:Uncharacterized protein n=1 Tax=Periplaneta americana TaxID=6978 RepID=A0ABQ8RZ04_PERAM|nr:hypothetical protein ANN_26579 [Periplaneta americana]
MFTFSSDERGFNIESFSHSIFELQSWKGVANDVDPESLSLRLRVGGDFVKNTAVQLLFSGTNICYKMETFSDMVVVTFHPWRERDSQDIVTRIDSCEFRLLLTSAKPHPLTHWSQTPFHLNRTWPLFQLNDSFVFVSDLRVAYVSLSKA